MYGGCPSSISYIMMPRLQISTLVSYGCDRMSSGAIQYGEPTTWLAVGFSSVSCTQCAVPSVFVYGVAGKYSCPRYKEKRRTG